MMIKPLTIMLCDSIPSPEEIIRGNVVPAFNVMLNLFKQYCEIIYHSRSLLDRMLCNIHKYCC